MTLTFFLRRHRVSPDRLEYFYLTVEGFDISMDDNFIAPGLPGNDASTLHGTGSTNFQIDLGRIKTGFRISGFLVPTVGADYPTATGVHVITVDEANPSAAEVEGTKNSDTVSGTVLGKTMRSRLMDYIADQPKTGTFDKYEMGTPDWGGPSFGSSPADQTVNGISGYRVWEGLARNFTSREVAGEPDQYMFAFEFTVGDN